MNTCFVCGQELTQKPMGRPRTYCGDACRTEVRKARDDLDRYRLQAEAATRLADAADSDGMADAYRATATTAAANYRAAVELVTAADASRLRC